ncbi:MAG TPA: adenosylcobinamide-GDP ribazoletransferase [Xanthobacteraceae bacterium]
MSELRRLIEALRFMTVLPLPKTGSLEPEWLTHSAKYFPLAGILVGALSAAVLLVASEIFTGALPALLAVTAAILFTGALHEDGLADTADALGGGRTREARLAIMKDSRIGTYGALALGLGIALRVAALMAVPPQWGAAALIAAHGGGRLAAFAVMAALPYAGERSAGKVAHSSERYGLTQIVPAGLFALVSLAPALWLDIVAAVVAFDIAALAALWLALRARRLLGGYTGDVLGAAEQVFEIALLLAWAALAGLQLGR